MSNRNAAKAILARTVRGCGTLPYVGAHPGTVPLVVFVVIAGAAVGWGGALLALTMFGPLYLLGAYERAAFAERAARKAGEPSQPKE
jgi:hypothetical protein